MKELKADLTKEVTQCNIMYNKPGEEFCFVSVTMQLTKHGAFTTDPNAKNHLLEILDKKDGGHLVSFEILLSEYDAQYFWDAVLTSPFILEMKIPETMLKNAINLVRGDVFYKQ